VEQIPDKPFYRVSEVCQYTDTQPYVLRFWESEFPQLKARKNRSGQRVYTREDIGLILRIKKLLYDEDYTLSGARDHIEGKSKGSSVARVAAKKKIAKAAPAAKARSARDEDAEHLRDKVAEMRDRYESACREIESLGEKLEATKELERELTEARSEAASLRERLDEMEKKDAEGARTQRDEQARLRADLEKAETARDRYRKRAHKVARELEKVVKALERISSRPS
jgi:DNA-binding transcriptional MerR regulator